MGEPDVYLLGRSENEELRLKRQIADLAPLSDEHLARLGIRPGEKVVDLGCGPGGVLHLLGKRVGPSGSVLGIERSRISSTRQVISLACRKSRCGKATPMTRVCLAPHSTGRICVLCSSTCPNPS